MDGISQTTDEFITDTYGTAVGVINQNQICRYWGTLGWNFLVC